MITHDLDVHTLGTTLWNTRSGLRTTWGSVGTDSTAVYTQPGHAHTGAGSTGALTCNDAVSPQARRPR